MPGDETPTRTDANTLAKIRTDLSYERSRLASDRTTMAYLRTAISLIGFGFSIPTFFQVLKSVPGFESVSATPPRLLGVALLFLSVAMLVGAIIQQGLYLRRLEQKTGGRHPFSIALASCVVVLAIGLMAMTYVALQIGRG
jgi:putative membrane protein